MAMSANHESTAALRHVRARAVSWDPNHPAVFVAPTDSPHVTLVRHDGHPYEERWVVDGDNLEGLFEIANRYIRLVNARLKLPQAWLDDLLRQSPEGPRPLGQLVWLREPADKGDQTDKSDMRHSYWVNRQTGLDDPSRPTSGHLQDRTAVLLASLGIEIPSKRAFSFAGGQGLRILALVVPNLGGRANVRIMGVSSTLPFWDGKPLATSLAEPAVALSFDLFSTLTKALPRAFAREAKDVVDFGLWLPSPSSELAQYIYVSAKAVPDAFNASRRSSANSVSHLLVARVKRADIGTLEPVAKVPLVAFAVASVYTRDPACATGVGFYPDLRPNRSWLQLDGPRTPEPLGNLPPGNQPDTVLLADPHANPDFRVANSLLVDPPLTPASTKAVPESTTAHARSNDFAAVNAFHHTSDLFHRMRRYGLATAAYFRFVNRPITVGYRAGIFPGSGDGRTVNAQVRWIVQPASGTKGDIEVAFALGDLQSAAGRTPANLPVMVEHSPLGVAGDPRWCWHEYSHVLIAAATGALELGFAHSAGDALAAIACDPESRLACNASGAADNTGPWRGATFPWIVIPRRHDRDVLLGWGWTGPMYRDQSYGVPMLSNKRGYWTEQILSSCLFRLYRAIGGDSTRIDSNGRLVPAVDARLDAADYAIYLIMRAIWSLGPAAITPCLSPDQFADALRKADIATASVAGTGGYVGGTVHKVIQWAFERQGLYGVPVPFSAVSGADEAAKVDLHIEDRRPKPDGPYSPVSLLGQEWHAHAGSLSVSNAGSSTANKKVRLKVHNRGSKAAFHTRVRVWYAVITNGKIPDFPGPSGVSATWHPIGSAFGTVPRRVQQKPGAANFGPFNWTPPTGQHNFAILAAASCAADRSNIDPATGFPSVSVSGPVSKLVACDNNLGLITIAL